MSESRPLFAFAFRSGLGHMLCDFADADASGDNVDFVWVHLDLSDATAQAWLRRRPWPADVIEMVAAPVQRGRLFIAPDMVYGHLRDFRDAPDAVTLQAGSLCVVASRTLFVTGRRIPLRSVQETRRRVEAGTIRPETPFGLITEFFRALNDIGEGLLQKATERLSAMESKVLKTQHRREPRGNPGDATRISSSRSRYGLQAHGHARTGARASCAAFCRRIRPL